MKNSSISLVVAWLIVLSVSSAASDGNNLNTDYCRTTVEAVKHLHEQTDKRFFEKREQDINAAFKPQEYFSIFKHLSLPEGCVLDSVYDHTDSDARPVLYIRNQEEAPYRTYAEYRKATGIKQLFDERKYDEMQAKKDEYRTFVRTDGSAESFFELAVYSILAGQYALMWHSNYFDTQVLVDKEAITEVLRTTPKEFIPFTKEQKEAAERIDPTPIVKMNEDTAEVALVLFSKWGGFTRRTFTYKRTYPHEVQTKNKTLVKYDCGVMF